MPNQREPATSGGEQFVLPREDALVAQRAAIETAKILHPQSGAWTFFMREVLNLPPQMTHAVLQVIRLEKWQYSLEPLAMIRADALILHGKAWEHIHTNTEP